MYTGAMINNVDVFVTLFNLRLLNITNITQYDQQLRIICKCEQMLSLASHNTLMRCHRSSKNVMSI